MRLMSVDEAEDICEDRNKCNKVGSAYPTRGKET